MTQGLPNSVSENGSVVIGLLVEAMTLPTSSLAQIAEEEIRLVEVRKVRSRTPRTM